MKSLVIIPTYNEATNVASLLPKLLEVPDIEILVVDDNSPDGTAGIVEQIKSQDSRVHLLRRAKKEGLARAYLCGFQWGLERDFDAYIEMDADFSHRPQDLQRLLRYLEHYDVVVGCRYMPEGRIDGWSSFRRGLSRSANWYAQRVLSLPLDDLTGGFNGWKKKVLTSIGLDQVQSTGYAFQVELKARAYQKRFRILEMPIVFENRKYGKSKMNSRIVAEAAFRVFQMRFAQ